MQRKRRLPRLPQSHSRHRRRLRLRTTQRQRTKRSSRTVKLGSEDKYTAALKSLLAGTTEKGQTNVFPKHVKLRSVKVQDGVATVDFSKELQKNFNGGSTGEEMLVGSIVNTLTDFPEVKKVRIRIEGEDVETLSGHMDLSEPLPRMTELLK